MILLSSLRPVDLMAGKILGIAATGITIVGTWLVLFLAVVLWLPGLLGAPVSLDMTALVDRPIYLVSFFVYFLLGYLFYAALLCGIGSMANNLKEAQTLMMPVQLLLVVPLIVMVPIGRDPHRPVGSGLVVAAAVYAVRDDESSRLSTERIHLRRHYAVDARFNLLRAQARRACSKRVS